MNFGDLDVVVIGPVVKEVSNQFDLYWNNQSSIPMAALVRQNTTPRQFTEKRAALTEYHTITERSAYAHTVHDGEFVRQLRSRNVSYFWGRATIVNDHPDKVATSAAKIETHLAPQLRDVVAKTKREPFLVSPYFVYRLLQPRSALEQLNTEMGVLFNCPALAKRLPETTQRDLDRNAYHVELDRNRLTWVTREGDNYVHYNSEPEATLWNRIKAQVLSWLPIESLL